MIKYILTIALALTAGFAFADDAKKKEGADKPRKKPPVGEKGDRKGGKGAFFEKIAGEDKVLTAEEWENSPMAKKAKEAGKGEMVAARFKKMDADSDGKVTQEEFAKAFAGRGKGKGDKKPGDRKPGGDKKPEGKKPKADS
ncbi:MAG: hypothetical protein HKN23_17220 [Verrucomicrobiales bacterium]|nr:hypothetical protein [Verrucomicrobiales bacterium]